MEHYCWVVREGDTLSEVAKHVGVKSWKDIWNLPANKAISELRVEPIRIKPGDVFVLPVYDEPERARPGVIFVDGEAAALAEASGTIVGINTDHERTTLTISLPLEDAERLAREGAFLRDVRIVFTDG